MKIAGPAEIAAGERAAALARRAFANHHQGELMNLTIVDQNPAHPDCIVTTVKNQITSCGILVPSETWTVIGTPNGPDLVIDPEGKIHSLGWGGPELVGFFTPEAKTVYEFVNKECFS